MSETGFFSILLIGLGLAADCFAVSLASSITLKKVPVNLVARVSLAFGIFQGGMVVLGWLAGSSVIDYIAAYDHWLAFGLLAIIGGHMLWESRSNDEEKEGRKTDISRWPVLLTLAVATSIDALAVGLSFAFLQVNLAMASVTIGVTSLVITVIGLYLGNRVGRLVGKRAEIIGGLVLIGIGIRILIEHLT